MSGCPFCKESFFPYHKKLGLCIEDAIVFSDEHVFVTPDISPISEGHYLIITWEHYCNFASAPQKVRNSFYNALRFICEKIYKSNDFLLFEHGSTNVKKSGNSIDHAHIHVIKGKKSILNEVKTQNLFSEQINISLEEYAKKYSSNAYIWVLENDSSNFFISLKLPSQYLRKVFKDKYPNDYSFDWRKEYAEQPSLKDYFYNLELATARFKFKGTEERIKAIKPKFSKLLSAQLQTEVLNLILACPYEKINEEQMGKLFDNPSIEGLFYLSSRETSPAFLLNEQPNGYRRWKEERFKSEINQLKNEEAVQNKINLYGEELLLQDCVNVLDFRYKNGLCLDQLISNQIYSDIFRRIVIFLLTGDAFKVFHAHKNFNDCGKNYALYALNKVQNFSVEELIYYSVVCGVVGTNVKESIVSTSPCSLASTYALKMPYLEENARKIHAQIIKKMGENPFMQIDDRSLFVNEVLYSKNKTLTFVTDDYIEGVIELYLAQKLLEINSSLKINFVTRYNQYSNDLSFSDVQDLLNESIFAPLKTNREKGRFYLEAQSFDVSTFAKDRISNNVFNLFNQSDFLYIIGARAFEMAQGINKTVYYSGISVCKGYSESVTGFSKNSGALIFMRASAGERLFKNFKARANKSEVINGECLSLAEVTAKEIYERRKGNK